MTARELTMRAGLQLGGVLLLAVPVAVLTESLWATFVAVPLGIFLGTFWFIRWLDRG